MITKVKRVELLKLRAIILGSMVNNFPTAKLEAQKAYNHLHELVIRRHGCTSKTHYIDLESGVIKPIPKPTVSN